MNGSIWVTVAVTGRPRALRRMLADILHQCREAGATLTIFILENSSHAEHRAYTRATSDWLTSEGVPVTLESAPPFGRPIAESRRRQRDWVAARARGSRPPDVIWMLDDDNRLDHLVWDGTLGVRRLENHVVRLLDMARDPSRPDLLIGEVTGDPPIPPAATLASRLADVEANLQRLLEAHPDDPASSTLSDLRVAGEHDDYYDFSVERSQPTWASPCRWLSHHRDVPVSTAANGLITEARCLANGIALTRPLLTSPANLQRAEPGYRRGGNAVFFSMEACLQHRYPSVQVAGRWTRRGDMVGSRLLSRSFRVEVSGFSVRHCRRRNPTMPTTKWFVDSIVADNLGATLARAIESPQSIDGMQTFAEARVDRIHRALSVARTKAEAVSKQMERLPPWVSGESAPQLRDVLACLQSALPPDATLTSIDQQLTSTKTLRLLLEVAARECRALEATP